MLESLYIFIGIVVFALIIYIVPKVLEQLLYYGGIAIMYSIPFLLFGGGLYLLVWKGGNLGALGLFMMLFGGVIIYCMIEVWKERDS